MMNFLSRWRKRDSGQYGNRPEHQSLLWLESELFPGVEFSIRKVSLAQRIELSARMRELTLKNDFLKAGELTDQLQATMADLLVKQLYVEWAVVDLKGLVIDGEPASLQLLLSRGPEALVNEVADAIHKHLELSDVERKNS
jgi:hypothetical protein